jgi:hypothetical protein
MNDLEELREAVARAEAESAELYRELRAAHRRFFDADMRLLHARLDLDDALHPTPDNREER